MDLTFLVSEQEDPSYLSAPPFSLPNFCNQLLIIRIINLSMISISISISNLSSMISISISISSNLKNKPKTVLL